MKWNKGSVSMWINRWKKWNYSMWGHLSHNWIMCFWYQAYKKLTFLIKKVFLEICLCFLILSLWFFLYTFGCESDGPWWDIPLLCGKVHYWQLLPAMSGGLYVRVFSWLWCLIHFPTKIISMLYNISCPQALWVSYCSVMLFSKAIWELRTTF